MKIICMELKVPYKFYQRKGWTKLFLEIKFKDDTRLKYRIIDTNILFRFWNLCKFILTDYELSKLYEISYYKVCKESDTSAIYSNTTFSEPNLMFDKPCKHWRID